MQGLADHHVGGRREAREQGEGVERRTSAPELSAEKVASSK